MKIDWSLIGFLRVFQAAALLLVGMAGCVLGLSNEIPMVTLSHPLDKLAHFIVFAVFTFLLGSFVRNYVFAALAAIAVGVGIEIIQIFVPGREFSFLDIVANAFGVLLIVLLQIVRVSRLL